jgi:predicted ATPase
MIHRVRVRNFKSIIDVDVDLSPVTVLVGKSGVGESNFVQALRVLRNVLSGQAQVEQQQWPQLRPAMASDDPTLFQVEFSIAGMVEKFRYELSISKDGPQQPLNEEPSTLLGPNPRGTRRYSLRAKS